MNTLKFPKIIHVRLKDPSCRRDIDEMWKRFTMFQRNRIWILIFHIVPHSIFSIHMLCCRCHMWKAENVESCGLLIKIQRFFLGSKNFKLPATLSIYPRRTFHIQLQRVSLSYHVNHRKSPVVIHLAKILTSSIYHWVSMCVANLESYRVIQFSLPTAFTRCLQWKIYSNWNISVCSTRSILCWWKTI